MIKTIIIQGLGALTTILLTALISRKAGIDGQGYWAELKSNTEFLAALLAFGFPSSAAYLIRAKGQHVNKIIVSFFVYAFIASAALAAFYLSPIMAKPNSDFSNSIFRLLENYPISLILALYFVYRGVYLALATNALFDIATAILPVFLLACFFFFDVNSKENIHAIYMYASFLLTGVIVLGWHLFLSKKSNKSFPDGELVNFKVQKIILESLPNFGAIILPYLYPVLLYNSMRINGYSEYDMGIVSLCLLVQGAALLIPNIIGPRLYKDWINMGGQHDLKRLYKTAIRYSYLLSVIIGLALIIASSPITIIITGAELPAAYLPLAVILSTLPLSAALRPMLNLCMSQGGANYYMISLLIKSCALILFFLILPEGGSNKAAEIIAITEIIGFAMLVFLSSKYLKWSYTCILGFE